MMRIPLINRIVDTLFDRSKKAVPSAFAVGKILTGATQSQMEFDHMTEPGMYRFDTDATCETQPVYPFKQKSGFLSVFTVTPEDDTSQYQNTKNVRQVAWLDDTAKAQAYTRTGYYNSTEEKYVWGSKWLTLGSSGFGDTFYQYVGASQFGPAHQYIENDLNNYTTPGVWIVGEPMTSGYWLNFPRELGRGDYRGILIVLSENELEEYPEGTTPNYHQVLYIFNGAQTEPFHRSKVMINGEASGWSTWYHSGRSAYLAQYSAQSNNPDELVEPGLYAVDEGYVNSHKNFPEFIFGKPMVEVKRLGREWNLPDSNEYDASFNIQQTLYLPYAKVTDETDGGYSLELDESVPAYKFGRNKGGIWIRTGVSAELKREPEEEPGSRRRYKVLWSPWVKLDAGLHYEVLTFHKTHMEVWNPVAEMTQEDHVQETARVGTTYISGGNWVLQLPDPVETQIGDTITLIQTSGKGAIVCTTVDKYDNRYVASTADEPHITDLDGFDYCEITEPIYKRNNYGAIAKEVVDGQVHNVIDAACVYKCTVVEENGQKYWQLDVDSNGSDETNDSNSAYARDDRVNGARVVYSSSAIDYAHSTFEQVGSLNQEATLAMIRRWHSLTIVVNGGNPTIELPTPTRYDNNYTFSNDWNVSEEVDTFVYNELINSGRIDFNDDGIVDYDDLWVFFTALWVFDSGGYTVPSTLGADILRDLKTDPQGLHSPVPFVTGYPLTEAMAEKIADVFRFMKASLSNDDLYRLTRSKFDLNLEHKMLLNLNKLNGREHQLAVNIIVMPGTSVSIVEKPSSGTRQLDVSVDADRPTIVVPMTYMSVNGIYQWVYLSNN